LENSAIHSGDDIRELTIEATGANSINLSPYSPDVQCRCELMFGEFITGLKRQSKQYSWRDAHFLAKPSRSARNIFRKAGVLDFEAF
jgi:hypothetical protein